VAYLERSLPATAEVLALAAPAEPTEVFRLSAVCQTSRCPQFAANRCSLITRIVQLLPAVVDRLPQCHIRPECRWFHQEGVAACSRCPQIATVNYEPSALLRRVIQIPPSDDLPAADGARPTPQGDECARNPLGAVHLGTQVIGPNTQSETPATLT
jgi:hypothetical protein